MNEFLEYEESKKTIKPLNLDDFSVGDLENYLNELQIEIVRVKKEIEKKTILLNEADKFFR